MVLQGLSGSTVGSCWGDVHHTAKNRGRGPLPDKLRLSQRAVKTSPPVDAEGTVIQLPQVHLCTQPVPADGGEKVGDRKRDSLAGERRLGCTAVSTSTTSLPDGTQRRDTKASPHLEGAGVLGGMRPAGEVVRQQNTGQARGRRLVGEVSPRGEQPIDDRGDLWAREEGVGKRLRGARNLAVGSLATHSSIAEQVLLPPHVSQKGAAAQNTMEELPTRDAEGPVQRRVT